MPAFLDYQHLQAFILNTLRLCAWLVLLSVIFLPLERLFSLHPRKFFSKALAQDLGYYFVSGLVPSMLLAMPLSIAAMLAHSVMPPAVQTTVAAWPLWLRIVAGLVVGEIGFYWGHRWAHEIPLLWRFHSIHHSAKDIYFLISSRAHPFDNVFIRLCGLVPAYILGVASPLTPNGTLVPVMIVLIATSWGFFIHANVRWRLAPLHWIVATPAFHHWHHTADEQRNHNYASMLPWIDRLFGTYHVPENQWPKQYGIDETLPQSLMGQLIYPFRSSDSSETSVNPIAESRVN